MFNRMPAAPTPFSFSAQDCSRKPLFGSLSHAPWITEIARERSWLAKITDMRSTIASNCFEKEDLYKRLINLAEALEKCIDKVFVHRQPPG